MIDEADYEARQRYRDQERARARERGLVEAGKLALVTLDLLLSGKRLPDDVLPVVAAFLKDPADAYYRGLLAGVLIRIGAL